jgi:hypothetical protein
MQDKFEKLLETEDQDRKSEIKAFFLDKTPDKLKSTGKESALKVAVAFDRFKKEAEQAGESQFTQLFGVLSRSLKDQFLDTKDDLRERKPSGFLNY